MLVQNYLMFDGRCDEALEFYRRAIGAEVQMRMTFAQNPDKGKSEMCMQVPDEKVMHASFKVGDTVVMASDGQCGGKPNFQGFALSLTVANEAEADRKFAALSEGGKVMMPLAKTFFSPRFGMLADKFGVPWMVIVPGMA